ncbi:unnamed protein product [Oppiella nova]|uniref:glutamine synthetase n=1 Tax=Oppiella nova TaxID=334625 RepID=A0A7R9LVT1_9ACAR|nr:unnamed protein product [Oppiella nova]CAG2167352.1 unnamed protein product [Oppiella nova]
MSLEQPDDKVQVTYVYLHPGNDDQEHFCGKTKVVDFVPKKASELPIWDSGVPTSSEVEILLRPVRLYNDPFRRGNNKLVLCDTLSDDMTPLPSNHRQPCLEAMEAAKDEHPWFGLEQEYMLMDVNDNWPLGWPKGGYPEDIHLPHVLYHSAVGANKQFGRDVMDAHFRACLYAGVNISGENAEAMPSQWEYQVTYVFSHPAKDGLEHLCNKSRVIDFVPKQASDLPVWDCGLVTDTVTEMVLRPVRLYNDPFRGGNNKLVLCDTLTPDMTPMGSNHRQSCREAMEAAKGEHPWFSLEQEYLLLDASDNWPLGWPKGGYPESISSPNVHYLYGVGANIQCGRDVMEAHFRACLYAGVNISGENAEAITGQWEYQVGPCEGIRIGDDVLMSRYLLHRVAEDLRIAVTFDPKPIPNMPGSGAHMNFSTEKMRAKGGLTEIERAIEKLSKRHEKHLALYDPHEGADNARRLIGSQFYGSDMNTFTSGVGNRGASIRIPKRVAQEGRGYMEDRRPAANCDPYMVAEALVRTCLLNE